MATSGTASFDLSLEQIVEDAYEQCGMKLQGGQQMRTALRSMNLLFIEWQNRGFNFWTVEQRTQALSAGTASYTLGADVFDVAEAYIRTGSGETQTDLPVTRMSLSDYAALANKNSPGRPVQYYLDKQRVAQVINVWPVPTETSSLVYHALCRIEDAGTNASNTADVPFRFLPALVAGLAYKLAVRHKQAETRIPILKVEYEEQWALAEAGDRDRSSFYIRPDLRHLR